MTAFAVNATPGVLSSGALDRDQVAELVGKTVTVVDYQGRAWERVEAVGISTWSMTPSLDLRRKNGTTIRVLLSAIVFVTTV